MKVEVIQPPSHNKVIEIRTKDNVLKTIEISRGAKLKVLEVSRDARGESSYEIAVRNGFQGTEIEWLASIIGKSAYQIALDEGYVGTRDQWLDSLKGASAYEVALDAGFTGTEQEWLDSLKLSLAVSPSDAGKILSNDGSDYYWEDIETVLNSNVIRWDLGNV